MSHSIAHFQVSTEEDLGFDLAFVGLDLTGRILSMTLRERATGASRTVLTLGSGLQLVSASTLRARVARSSMTGWPRGEYTADLIETTGGMADRLMPVMVYFDEPGRLGCGRRGDLAQIQWSPVQAVVTAYKGDKGDTGSPGPSNVLTTTAVTLPPGSFATATITGVSPAQELTLGIPEGLPGAGAPTSQDIQALTRYASALATMRSIGVKTDPALFLDFTSQTYVARDRYAGASYTAMLTALTASFTRASTATYFDNQGVMRTAAANVPRFTHSPLTKAPLGFLIEASRTNMLLRSTGFEVPWTLVGATLPLSGTVSLDAAGFFTRLTESATDSLHYMSQSVGGIVSGSTYSYSVYAQEPASNLSKRNLTLVLPATVFGANKLGAFDLATGIVTQQTTDTTTGMENCGGGIWRCWVAAVATASGSVATQIRLSQSPPSLSPWLGDGVSGINIWGAQLEAGLQPTSYIPTAASALARATETSLIVNNMFSAPVTSMLAGFTTPADTTVLSMVAEVSDGTYTQRYFNSTNAGQVYMGVTAGTAQVSGISRVVPAVGASIAMANRFQADNFAASINGAAIQADLIGAMPAVNRLSLGRQGGGFAQYTGIVERILWWDKPLSNTQLVSLSDPTIWS